MKLMYSRLLPWHWPSVIRLLALLALACIPSLSTAVTATATVNVTARYAGQTCYFDSSSQTIDFGTVSAMLFDSAGATASGTVRNFSVKAYCQEVGLATMYSFETTADANDSKLVRNSGTATGVGIALTYANDGSSVLNNPYFTLGIASGWTTINLSAALRRTSGTFQGGTVSAAVVVKLTYL